MKDGLNLSKFVIVPTGDEILNGIVSDTNSPAIMSIIIKHFPGAKITKLKPLKDDELTLIDTFDSFVGDNEALIIFIGGSGGGKRFVDTLAPDHVSDILHKKCDFCSVKELYGQNGHLWSKLIVGKINKTWIFNVPGPHKEAVAATNAFFDNLKVTNDLDKLVQEVAREVEKLYG